MPLCMGCLNEIPAADSVCKVCGFDNSEKQTAPFLPYGTVLNHKYVVAKNLDTNGESTRYLGYDKTNGKVLSIREFLPIGLFDRGDDETKLFVTPQDKSSFTQALEDFTSYYETLNTLTDKAAMLNIEDIFTENGTAYVIEENDDLISFTEYIEHHGGHLEWDTARPLFMPIITLIENIHKLGIGHYAISPSNLYVTSAGKLKLGGFSTENERKRGTMLKSQLYGGCAAPEQYQNNATLDVATDIYGLTATLFYALTGNLPASAKEREKDARLLISTNTVKRLPPHVVTALANGLQMKSEARISDFDELRAQLSVSSTVQAIQDEISRTASMTPIQKEAERSKSGVNPTAVGLVATLVALLVFAAIGLLWLPTNPLMGLFTNGSTVPATLPAPTEDWTGPVMADYTGQKLDDVKAAFQGAVKVSADGDFSDTVPKGNIISQEPPAGSPIMDTGSEAVLYVVVSKGPQMVELPDVVGKSYTAAAEELTNLGLVALQEVEYNSTVAEGKVIEIISHQAGDKIEAGSEITVKVSLGKEKTSSSN
ncbi:PASTA domain-containing protein [Ruminococcus sp.]|uniref:PASTA domain-containing protein n=1 Tax=Ruminococcus sp. TaxID=41978 RepID=UPI00388FCD88